MRFYNYCLRVREIFILAELFARCGRAHFSWDSGNAIRFGFVVIYLFLVDFLFLVCLIFRQGAFLQLLRGVQLCLISSSLKVLQNHMTTKPICC